MPVLTEDAIRRLPEPIVAKLRSLIARIRRVLWWRGCWLTLAALVGFTLIFGPLGLILALPMAVCFQVLIRDLLINDLLDGWKRPLGA